MYSRWELHFKALTILQQFNAYLQTQHSNTPLLHYSSIFNFVSHNLEAYDYVEQFSNSHFSSLVDKEALEKEYLPLINVLAKGIEQKIIKDVDMNMVSAFLFNPVSRLANPRLCYGLEMDGERLEQAFTMAWDAIRL